MHPDFAPYCVRACYTRDIALEGASISLLREIMRGEKLMGTFADFYAAPGAEIPDEKLPEFEEKLKLFCHKSGLMAVDTVSMFGKKMAVLRWPEVNNEGVMEFWFNYYEDDSWESAGYSRKRKRIWSNKIGWREFNHAIIGAYSLAKVYTAGLSEVFVDGRSAGNAYISWLNHILQAKFQSAPMDPWPLYVSMHYDEEANPDHIDWDSYLDNRQGTRGVFDIEAVEKGSASALQNVGRLTPDGTDCKEGVDSSREGVFNIFHYARELRKSMMDYHRHSHDSAERQLGIMLDVIKDIYNTEAGEEKRKKWDIYKASGLEDIFMGVYIADQGAFAVQVLAEIYDKDFWELWEQVKDVIHRFDRTGLEDDEGHPLPPRTLATEKVFQITWDDMLASWTEDDGDCFSADMKCQFSDWRRRVDAVASTGPQQLQLRKMIETAIFADEKYRRIFLFENFIEELMDGANSDRLRAAWQVWEEMVYDENLLVQSAAVWEDPEEKIGSRSWTLASSFVRRNPARMQIKRFAALLGNKALRQRVLGV